MKFLVETKGAFMLSHFGQEVQAERPGVITATPFFEHRIALGQLINLGKVSDAATDDDFVKFLDDSDNDMPLAVESFLSAFAVVEVTAKGDDDKQEELPLKPGRKGAKS